MPIYEYVCKDCGNKFEMLRSFSEADASVPCKMCQGKETHRTISVFNAQSGSRIIAGGNQGGCGGCAGGTCSSCNPN